MEVCAISCSSIHSTQGKESAFGLEDQLYQQSMTTPSSSAADPNHAYVRVGVGVMVLSPQDHPHSVIIGRRKGSHGANTLALPGKQGLPR